jgi:serine/threonine-protein kinase
MSAEPQPSLEDLVEAFVAARRRGAAASAREVAARHPELGPELLAALEAAEALAALPAADSPAGRSIGPYRLLRELGRGGMGVVYEALDPALGRAVALKVLPPELLASASMRARFRREAELASRIAHPGVCTVFAAGIEDGAPWIAMQLVRGETLARRIERARAAGPDASLGPARDTAVLMARVARALEAAHALGVLHRDVKPANVMVTPEGLPVLLDFGLARSDEPGEALLTRTGETTGTPAYLAPEMIAGELARPDARCDVYSLGVMLFECLALERPFQGPTQVALYRAVLAGAPARLPRARAPRDLAVVTATALERDRARRYAGAADLAADLEAFADGRPVAARALSAPERLLRWARREPRLAAISGVLAATGAALALAAGAVWSSRDEVRAAESERAAREVEAAVVEGFADLADGQHDAADAAFARALALAPAHAEALAGRAFASLDRGRPEEARARLAQAPPLPELEPLRRAVRGEPAGEPEAGARGSALDLFLEGELLLRTCWELPRSERPPCAQRALALFDEAVARLPAARSLYHMERAYAAQAARDAQAARSAAEALATLWPDSLREVYTAGAVLTELDPPRACELLERAALLGPGHYGVFHNLGTAYLMQGDPERAERALRRALELAPDVADAHNGLGLALVDLGRTEEARRSYLRALELRPDMVEALSNLAELEYKQGEHPQSAEHYARVLELDPGSALDRHNYAGELYELGRYEDAREQYLRALDQDPSFGPTWAGLAWSLLALERPEEALEAANRGLLRAPGSEELFAVRGQVLAALGRSE